MTRAVAIGLKIPDNTAYTALTTLRRLGVNVARVERSEIRLYEQIDNSAELEARIKRDESVFNPNKHVLSVLAKVAPRTGEIWIAPRLPLGAGPAAIGWRLFDEHGEPAERAVLEAATERLLCNPAIDRAITDENSLDRDNPFVAEY